MNGNGYISLIGAAVIGMMAAGSALAQSTGASPADPNNERNQRMAPSNTQPTNPAASDNPSDRVPTDPGDRNISRQEEGGPAGTAAPGAAGKYGSIEEPTKPYKQ